jgi:hypothetical protein
MGRDQPAPCYRASGAARLRIDPGDPGDPQRQPELLAVPPLEHQLGSGVEATNRSKGQQILATGRSWSGLSDRWQ